MKLRSFGPVHAFLFAISICPLVGPAASAQMPGPVMTSDSSTLALIVPEGGGMVEKAQNLKVTVKGGKIVADSRFGRAVEFGNTEKNGIFLDDDGKLDFSRGLTLEMWIQFEQDTAPTPGGELFFKAKSFSTAVVKGKFQHEYTRFPKLSVATSTDRHLSYYPVGNENFYGAMDIAPKQWTHLAMTYDPQLKVIRTWIDGSLDRTRYRVFYHGGDAPIVNVATDPLIFARGMKNVRVAGIRVSKVARDLSALPPLEAYVHELTYQQQVAVMLDHIRASSLPLNIVFQWETPNGSSSVLQRFTLTTPQRKDVVFSPPGWKSDFYTLTVKASSNNREVYSRSIVLTNADTSKARVRLDSQRRLIQNERPVFPLFAYHVFPEDYAKLSEMGFNIINSRAPNSAFFGLGAGKEADAALEAAQTAKIGLSLGASPRALKNYSDNPGLTLWYGADEPWGKLDRLRVKYNMAKLLAPSVPVLIVQNNLTRMQETAEAADILGCDPYPIPVVSLRYVADATKAAIAATGGLKPVWTVLPQYASKRPSLEELRSMCYIAIASGADGLGIYAWDDRNAFSKEGWYTAEHPKDLQILTTVIQELKGLEKILLTPNSSKEITVAPANPALHIALKETGSERYLIIASDSRKAETAVLSIPGVTAAGAAGVLDPTDRAVIRDGKMDISLAPLGVRIYRLGN